MMLKNSHDVAMMWPDVTYESKISEQRHQHWEFWEPDEYV